VSRITDLIAQAKAKDAQLGADLEREFRALSSRLPFGLNFERHRPEAVELALRPIRKGDKVRVLPQRGSTEKADQRLWQVKKIAKAENRKKAELKLLDGADAQTKTVALDDLIVVAEFKDIIYPGLTSTGRVARGGDKPYHTVINGENYYVLKALTYTHRGKVDAIYIDPPYNTGAKDWKYNNDYVEEDDLYRHSKWLAMMERRLLIARELLNPADSVLIVTIDEKEYLRLGLLLEQIFPEANMQMVSSVINPKGTGRGNEMLRVNEFIFFLWFGQARLGAFESDDQEDDLVAWETMRRRNLASRRGRRGKGACGPNQFYPIYVNSKSGRIEHIGDPIPPEMPIRNAPKRKGCIAVFPIRPDGTEMNWSLTADTCRLRWGAGYVRAGRREPEAPQEFVIQFLPGGDIMAIESGEAEIVSRNDDGSIEARYVTSKDRTPTTQWNFKSHFAEHNGTVLLKNLIPERRFPFPKSLYAIEDALRLFIRDKATGIVVDFFSGSGTTAHAVMRLNRQDGGRRQSISITNNEVAADEQAALRKQGSRIGDAEWEMRGICDYITKPRVAAAITGKTPDGRPIDGDYRFTDEFPMADGFEENAEFFTLTYETPVAVSHHMAFARIAPLLWLRAGSRGRRIDKLPSVGWEVVDAYGLLIQLDRAMPFLKAVSATEGLRIVYIVTDDERRFQALAQRLPQGVEAVRLYESYLTNFAFTYGGDA
jgi:adenine-specific DNA-methyltransferase